MREWDLNTGERGLRLRICQWGEDGPDPLVILHGFLEQGAAWDAVAGHLDRPVIAPDQRGHGLSAHVGAGGFYHFWDYVPDAVALIEHLGAPVDVVGHSMGGGVACLLAAVRPDLVRRLVVVEGLGPVDASTLDVDNAVRFVKAMGDPPRHRPFATVADGVQRMKHYNRRLDDAVAERLVRRIARPITEHDRVQGPAEGLVWTWDPLHRARAPVPFRIASFLRFLERIEAPVLYVEGSDSWFRLPDLEERLAHLRSVERVVLSDAGHMMHHDQPEALAGHLAAFFAQE